MAENSKVGYYTQDAGQHVHHYFMGDEPPNEQYVLHGETWEPLVDPWYLMDMIINGQPDLTGPVANPPEESHPHLDSFSRSTTIVSAPGAQNFFDQ